MAGPVGLSFAEQQRDFALRKACTLAVSKALRAIAVTNRERKLADRLFFCGSKRRLVFRTKADGSTELFRSRDYACKSLLCPDCERDRAAKTRRKARAMVDRVWAEDIDTRFIFATFTTRNRPFDELTEQFGDHERALTALWRRKRIKHAVLGQLGSIEIAIRGTADEPEAGTHSHHLLAVPWDYFKGEKYLTQRHWQAEWKSAAKLSYRPIVHLRVPGARGDIDDRPAVLSTLRELCKYVCAPQTEFDLTGDKPVVNPRLLRPLIAATYRRRFFRFNGVFAEADKLMREEREVFGH